MIRLAATIQQQDVMLPRPKELPGTGTWSLILTKTSTGKTIEAVIAQVAVGALTVGLSLSLPKADGGEYRYDLSRGDEAVSTGLCIISADPYHMQHVEYNPDITTIEYNG